MYVFVYSDEYQRYDYGPNHPLKLRRLKLTHDLIRSFGLLDRPDVSFLHTEAADPRDALLFHEPEYLAFLEHVDEQGALGIDVASAARFNLNTEDDPGDNPLFPGVFRWGLLCVGATLQAARLLADGAATVGFNMCGGMHHALPRHASGFCYLNDAAIAIAVFRQRGYRVAYLDIDVHHGDGVDLAFRSSPDVLTISLHESGHHLFPGTGHETEIGIGPGKGYAVNVPLAPGSDDALFQRAFEEIAAPLVERFQPDVLVTQLGVDTFRTDPLADLNVTTNGFTAMVERMGSFAPRWLALGGGGYNIFNVARAWTLAWGIMLGVELADEAPASFLASLDAREVEELRRLRDAPFALSAQQAAAPAQHLDRVIASIQRNVFPLHGLRP